jgi:hypothetical protein
MMVGRKMLCMLCFRMVVAFMLNMFLYKVSSAIDLHSSTGCESVILLSPGRTATDTISRTIVRSTSLRYCYEIKEYFSHGIQPSAGKLKNCYDEHKGHGGVWIHVKPEHIHLDHSSGASLKTPEEFFEAAHEAGFKVVATSFRDNQLAREISSFEMKVGPSDSLIEQINQQQANVQLVAFFEMKIQEFNRGVQAAKTSRMAIVPITFSEIVEDVCGTGERVAAAAGCAEFTCSEFDGHTDQSHHDRTLAGRVGNATAALIVKQLTGTPYEWMLDLDAITWPSNVARPIPPMNE